MAKPAGTEQYVLLPSRGLRAKARGAAAEVRDVLLQAEDLTGTRGLRIDGRQVPLKVVDSLGPDGAKLVEMTAASALAIRSLRPGLRIVPLVWYTPAVAPIPKVEGAPPGGRQGVTEDSITLRVRSRTDKAPIVGAIVQAFVDYENRLGAQGVTDASGDVRLVLGSASVKLERLYVYPLGPQWTLLKKNFTVGNDAEVRLTPLDLSYRDGVRHFYGDADDEAGSGVTVGVIDTGVADHSDLLVAGGANTVEGEDPAAYGDNGQHHGTHVAGIVAARGCPPTGIRGVAPGVTLRSYRVFGEGSGSASSFAIIKAVDQAVADKCDLINMSLGTGQYDMVLQAAVDDARAAGSLCIIAAGNQGRAPVSFPATIGTALAVSAMGRKGTFPTSSAEMDTVAAPYGTDKKNFIADFSNVGPEIDLTAPGVGIISTVPEDTYAEISGTSMSCPAVTGMAARALDASILTMRRDGARSDAMVKAILATAKSLGFEPPFEGHGLPSPA